MTECISIGEITNITKNTNNEIICQIRYKGRIKNNVKLINSFVNNVYPSIGTRCHYWKDDNVFYCQPINITIDNLLVKEGDVYQGNIEDENYIKFDKTTQTIGSKKTQTITIKSVDASIKVEKKIQIKNTQQNLKTLITLWLNNDKILVDTLLNVKTFNVLTSLYDLPIDPVTIALLNNQLTLINNLKTQFDLLLE